MTLGKFRHLSQCSTRAGHLVILAIDHRANLRQLLEEEGPIADEEFRDFKLEVVEAARDQISAVLADPGFGLGPLVARRIFTGGLLAPLEITDYAVHPSQRELRLIPHWSIKKVKRMGCDGVKLLLPYHPGLHSAASKLQQVRELARECALRDLPFFLEPIACSLHPGEALSGAQQRRLTVDMAQLFCSLNVDILKLQLPSEECQWEATCRELTEVCTVPWTVLSGGVDFSTFCRQTEVACTLGASGVMVGRAVWSEATRLTGRDRTGFLQDTLPQRLRTLAELCARLATPWMKLDPLPAPALDWYETYGA